VRGYGRGAEAVPRSVVEALRLAEGWEELPGERRMVASVLRWLLNIGWLGSASLAAFEVPWRGRRIDLVTANGKGQLTAFEFKLDGTRRVFEQAMYNSISTHRSFVVSGARPSHEYRELAEAHGLGLIVVNGRVDLLQRSALKTPNSQLARDLRSKAMRRIGHHV
jgi:hypothetical protein